MANRLICRMSPLSRPVSKRTIRRKALIAGNKKGPHKLSTQPHEPVISFTSNIDVSGQSSSRSPGVKPDDCLTSLMKNKDTVSNQEHDDDNPRLTEEIFLKPAAIKSKKYSSCKVSRSPRVLKRRNSMPAFLSPGKTLLSRSMHGLDKIHRHRTVSMTTVDMRKLGEAIESQKRKKKKVGSVNNESQPNGADTSLGADDVSGSSSSPGVDADLFLAGLNKTQDSSRNLEDEEDHHSSDDSYLKPKGNKQKELLGCKKIAVASRPPRIRKQGNSLPSVSSGKRLLSRSMRGSNEVNRCRSLSVAKLDMKKLQEAIDLSQIRKKKKSDKVGRQNPLRTSKSPRQNIKERVYTAIDQMKQSKELSCIKSQHSVKEPEPNICNKVSALKQKENEETIMYPSSFGVLGPSGKTPDLDFNSLDEMYKRRFDPSQQCSEPEVNMDTVARFLSFQDEENDSRNSSPPSIQRLAFAGDIIDPESEVSDTTVDEANETILEKEIRSFFESKKQHTPRDFREGALALDVAPSCIQPGTDDGGSESEVISAGQKMLSQTIPEHDDVIDQDSHYSTSDSHIDIEDLQKLVENTRFSTTDSAGDNEDLQKQPDNLKNIEDLQKLAKDTSRTCSQGKADCDIVLERDKNEQTVPSSEDKLQTLSQKCGSKTHQDHSKTVTRNDFSELMPIDVDIGGTLDDSHTPFYHSTPADPPHHPADPPHHPEPQVKNIPHEILSAWVEIEKEKKTFVLYCHEDAAPCILEDFQSCDDIIDVGSLSLRNLNDRPSMMVQGMVLEDEKFTSPIRKSPKKNRKDAVKKEKKKKKEKKEKKGKKKEKEKKKMETKEKKKKKGKKKKKEKKKMETKEKKGNKKKKEKKKKMERKKMVTPITGAARKRNESRWDRELKEQSKPFWSDINLQPSMESDLGMFRRLRETAKTARKQRDKGHFNKVRDLEADDPDLMTFVDLLSFPDVFVTKKRDRPSFRKVPPSEIHSLESS